MATSITSNETVTKLLDTNANPAPLGLMGFALTTILLNIHNAGFFELNSIILAIGLWYGGIAQLIAGIMEWKKNNTFGTLAFTSYGAFWITLVFIWILPEMFPDLAAAQAPTLAAMGYFLLAWGIFTAYMFVGHTQTEPGAPGGLRTADASSSFFWPFATSPGTRLWASSLDM